MKHWEITDTGLIRHENQDAFGFAQLPGGYAVAVVCDGMSPCRTFYTQLALRKSRGLSFECLS